MPPDSQSISVVVPAYNGERLLPRALASVARQSLPPLEVVVVDDGSPDATAAAVDRFRCAAGVPFPVSCIRQANTGVAGARNCGIQTALGHWIAFLDQDDEWEPGHLSRLSRLAAATGATLVAGDCRIRSGVVGAAPEGAAPMIEGPNWWRKSGHQGHLAECPRALPLPDALDRLLRHGCFFLPSSVLARRAALMGAGLFDPELSGVDDYELWIRMATDACFVLSPEATAIRWVHATNVSADQFGMALQSLRLWRKVGAMPAVRADRRRARWVRRRLAEVHWHCGYFGFAAAPPASAAAAAQPRSPRACFAASLRQRPTLRAARFWIAACLPRPWLAHLRRQRAA